jgi:vancomycin resistance protein VanW
VLEYGSIARRHADAVERDRFGFSLAEHSSPLRRGSTVQDESLQRGKEQNVTRAVQLLDGLVIAPCEVFSYHRVVGRPSQRRGFADGPELHGGALTRGIGGGCCQVSNLLYWLALQSGMNIVERHRHSLDLFPDDARTVPFGCGATVFYNLADLRFENPWPAPVLVSLRVENGRLHGALRSAEDPRVRVRVYETDHRFVRDDTGWLRENRIRREVRTLSGALLTDHEVAHNRARVCYEPSDAVTPVDARTSAVTEVH